MATLLTSEETPLAGESCAPAGADADPEALSCELLTGRAPGIPGGVIRGYKKGYLERRRRSSGCGEYRGLKVADSRFGQREHKAERQSGEPIEKNGGRYRIRILG